MGLPGRTSLAWAVLVTTLASTARAETGEAVRLEYTAPPSCPDERTFQWRVAGRVKELQAPRQGQPARTFSARVETTDVGAVGYLTITDAEGGQTERAVEAEDCAELVDALALIVALAIDPHARSTPRADAPPPATSAPAPPPQELNRDEPAQPAERTSDESETEPAARTPWQGEVAAHALLVGGVAPEPLGGFDAGIGLARRGARRFRPSARLSFGMTASRSFGSTVGTGRFRWLAGRLEACPTSLELGSMIAVRPCAVGEWGVIRAEGSQTPDPRSASASWLAGGLLGAVVVTPGDWLLVEARASGVVPAARDRFLIADTVLHRLPAVTWRTEIGVGVRLP